MSIYSYSSGQIIIFLFKSNHFRTYFLYMTRYNNILRPVHDPPSTSPATSLRPPTTPPAQNLGGRDHQPPPGLTPMGLLLRHHTSAAISTDCYHSTTLSLR